VEKVMWFQYVGAKTRESVVLEMAHMKYEFSEANDYKCALPAAHMMDIIPMEKRDMFIPCQPPAPVMDKLKDDANKAAGNKIKSKDGKKDK